MAQINAMPQQAMRLELPRLAALFQNRAEVSERSATVFAFSANGFSVELTGTNFVYRAGLPTGGTVDGLAITSPDGANFAASDLHAPVAALLLLLNPANPDRAGLRALLAGDDVVRGGDGGDQITDNDGHNIIFGAAGADTITTGGGNDHIWGQSPLGGADAGDLISAGAGSDYVNGNAGDDTISGGDGADRLNGGAGNDSVSGDMGNDAINGNLGNDSIAGGDGNDLLRGGQGDDRLLGGAGNDLMFGDLGADRLTGGAGNDVFAFTPGASPLGGADTLVDFTHGADHIALGFTPAAVLAGTSAGAQAALEAARALFEGHAGDHEVAAIDTGVGTLLFWSASGGDRIDSVLILPTASSFAADDFV